jgi:S-adenosylmethionine hydrolase
MIITLTTDFGTKDYFVGSVKAVILTIHPLVRLVDVSHEVPARDIRFAAYVLKEACRYFPKGTVHLAVVDPEVGSERKPIIVQAEDHLFVGPDNGIFSYILRESGASAFVIENSKYVLNLESPTFQGRDLFAPAAAWLAKGIPPQEFGPPLSSPKVLPQTSPKPIPGGRIQGEVIYIDRFGNLITNLTELHAGKKKAILRDDRGREFEIKGSYSEGSPGIPAAILNSSGHLEIFLKEGSAQARLSIDRGEPVYLES